jgi:uncharacterized protein YdaU (DUF1376 family)
VAKDFLQYRNHYVRDWESSETVRLMSYTARGLYHALLDAQWEKGSIPAEPEVCERLLRCEPGDWAHFAPFFDQCFPVCADGRRRNVRLDEDRERAQELVKKKTGAAQKRWSKGADAEVEPESPKNDAPAMHLHSTSTADAEHQQCPTTTTTTYSLPDGSGAADDEQDPEPIEPEIIEPEVISTDPYPTVERILTALSQATDQPPPTAAMIRRYIGKSSSILRLVEFCGEADATVLLAWCALFKPELGYGAVFSNAQSLLAEARSVDWKAPASKGKPKWGDPADDVDRMLSEHDRLLAARAEEDRFIRENW